MIKIIALLIKMIINLQIFMIALIKNKKKITKIKIIIVVKIIVIIIVNLILVWISVIKKVIVIKIKKVKIQSKLLI